MIRVPFARLLALALAATPLGAAGAMARDMTFRVVPFGDAASCGTRCPQGVAAEGVITLQTAASFIAFLKGLGEVPGLRAVLLIHSPGGSVKGGVELGEALRALGISLVVARAREGGAVVSGACVSACVFALMGGRERLVPGGSKVAVHRMHNYRAGRDPAGDDPDRGYAYAPEGLVNAMRSYARRMGVSDEVVAIAERVAPDDVKVLSPAELARYGLVSRRGRP